MVMVMVLPARTRGVLTLELCLEVYGLTPHNHSEGMDSPIPLHPSRLSQGLIQQFCLEDHVGSADAGAITQFHRTARAEEHGLSLNGRCSALSAPRHLAILDIGSKSVA